MEILRFYKVIVRGLGLRDLALTKRLLNDKSYYDFAEEF